MKIYYAHSQAIYGTMQEARDIETLKSLGFEVYNPNNPAVQQACLDWRNREPPLGDIMEDVFMDLVLQCDALAFRAHPDGHIPAGIAREIEFATGIDLPVIELERMVHQRTLSIHATRDWLMEVGQR